MIRRAMPEDASRIAEILVFGKRVAYRDIFKDYKASFVDMQVVPLALEYARDHSLIDGMRLYDDGIVKGVLNGRAGDGGAEILELYVEPCFTNSGAGSALLTDFLNTRARNKPVRLWVIEQNAAARRFYERFGFVYAGDKRFIDGTRVAELMYLRPADRNRI